MSAWSHKESDTTEQHHHQCELTSLYFHSEMKCRAPCPSIPHPLLIVQTLHLLNLHSINHSSSPGLHAHNSWSLRAKFKYWWWWFSHSVIPDSFVTPCTVAGQAPLSMAFSRQEYWSGLPFPFSEDLPNPGAKPESSVLAGWFFTTEVTRETPSHPLAYKITQSIKINQVIFQGLLPSEMAHTLVCGVCFSLNKSTSYLSTVSH